MQYLGTLSLSCPSSLLYLGQCRVLGEVGLPAGMGCGGILLPWSPGGGLRPPGQADRQTDGPNAPSWESGPARPLQQWKKVLEILFFSLE